MLNDPLSYISRAEFVTLVGKQAGIDPKEYRGSAFQDVPADALYAPYLVWAKDLSLVEGYGNDQFGPEDNLTRAQFCIIVFRCMEAAGQPLDTSRFSMYPDMEKLSPYALDCMTAVIRMGFLSLQYDRNLAPDVNLQRKDAALFFSCGTWLT